MTRLYEASMLHGFILSPPAMYGKMIVNRGFNYQLNKRIINMIQMGCRFLQRWSAIVPAVRCKSGEKALHKTITMLFAFTCLPDRQVRQPFISISLLIISSTAFLYSSAQSSVGTKFISNKIKGLLLGTFIGDALGGPIEFQGHPEIQATPNPPKLWKEGELINETSLKEARERIYFREYKYLRPVPEPYGHWGTNAAPGTVTDDSRHKFILMHTLRKALLQNKFPVNDKDLAKGYLSWSKSNTIKTHSGYDTLVNQWLDESYKAIRWLLGNRKIGEAYPLERLWNALPTCYGQMVLTPMAALYYGQPVKAYLSTYNLAYFDNGFAKDMIGAINAGLAKALTLDPSKMSNEQLWNEVISTMRNTDPYDYTKVPWSERAVDRWLNLADKYVKQAEGSPAKLFALLEEEFNFTTKWEAQVPYTVIFSVLKICNYDPLAALQLSIEWGWDHDSYAQLLGAFIGAIYGPEIFREDMRATVTKRLQLDYDENIDEWTNTLMKIQQAGKTKELFAN
jgi:ADP-ribosylglycohydrolase